MDSRTISVPYAHRMAEGPYIVNRRNRTCFYCKWIGERETISPLKGAPDEYYCTHLSAWINEQGMEWNTGHGRLYRGENGERYIEEGYGYPNCPLWCPLLAEAISRKRG